jgi:hypothetical protein
LEIQHQAELNALKQEMQQKMVELEGQMKEMGQQVAVQTYQKLVNEASPLVTKSDHANLQHEMNVISTQLTTLIQMIKSDPPKAAIPAYSPPRTSTKRKINKPSASPEKVDFSDSDQEQVVPSATSTPDEGMEGCED